ncbi:MAG: hypothetical protein QM754_17420 [Tepidisphaeraceae bacterium]
MKPDHNTPAANRDFNVPLSVSEMAKVIGLSRSQFNEHVHRGVFPPPVYTTKTRRPFYTPEQQREVVAVRSSRIGVNGEFILFYEQRRHAPSTQASSSGKEVRPAANAAMLDDLMRAISEVGMATATRADVERAAAEVFPTGIPSDLSKVVQPVYLHLRRQGNR